MSRPHEFPEQVSKVFDGFAPQDRKALLDVRALIFDVAAADARIGDIEETLRWGEPAYITVQKKTGSTIRLSVERSSQRPALFFNCKTTLVEEFRAQFGDLFTYSKNRAVFVGEEDAQANSALKTCIAAALTYHLRT